MVLKALSKAFAAGLEIVTGIVGLSTYLTKQKPVFCSVLANSCIKKAGVFSPDNLLLHIRTYFFLCPDFPQNLCFFSACADYPALA